MSDTFFRFTDIEYGNGPANEKIVGIFRFEQARPTRPGPSQIMVAEIGSALYAYEQLIDVINAAIEQSRALMAEMTLDPFARFEKLVHRVNEAVAAFVEKEPTPIHWGRVNIFILEVHQDQLCVSGHGRLMNIFLQKTPDGGSQAFDLCGSLEQPSETDPKKLFASVICGDMKPGDLLFIGSTNFERLRQELRIKQRLSELPPVAATVEMKRDLERQGIPDDFAAAVISCHAGDKQPVQEPKPKEDSVQSIKKFNDNIQKTEKTLAPVVNPIKLLNNQPTTEAAPEIPQPISRSFIQNALSALTSLAGRRKHARPTPAAESALRGLHAGRGVFLTAKRKLLIGGAITAVIIGGIAYGTWSHNRKLAAEQAAWQSDLAIATDLRNQAEASFVYAKDTQTRSQIEQSEASLAALDVSTPERQSQVDKLRGELSQLRERLRKNVAVSNLVELYALDVTVPDGMLSAPVMTDTAAFAADNAAHAIVRVDLTSRERKTVNLPAKAGRIVAGSLGDKSIVFVDDLGQLYAVSTADASVSPLNKITSSSSTSITDLVLYNQRAYALDGRNGGITRYSKSNAGFGGASAYAAASAAQLANGVGLAIDSNVYVAKSDGTLIRFLSGAQETFNLSVVDPPLRSLTAIWTDVDDQRILLTDPADKRILIFDKNGLLLSQLSSPEFTSLRDIACRTSAKQALAINSNRLLLVPLP